MFGFRHPLLSKNFAGPGALLFFFTMEKSMEF